MAFDKQSAFNGVNLQVSWPDLPEAVTVVGTDGKQQVIAEKEFRAWVRALSQCLQAQFDATAREIEKLNSASK